MGAVSRSHPDHVFPLRNCWDGGPFLQVCVFPWQIRAAHHNTPAPWLFYDRVQVSSIAHTHAAVSHELQVPVVPQAYLYAGHMD